MTLGFADSPQPTRKYNYEYPLMRGDIAFVLVLVFTLGSLVLGLLGLFKSFIPKTVTQASLALGLALVSLAITVFIFHTTRSHQAFPEVYIIDLVALAVYSIVFGFHIIRDKPKFGASVVAVIISALVFYFVGFYLALMVDCSFGDCL